MPVILLNPLFGSDYLIRATSTQVLLGFADDNTVFVDRNDIIHTADITPKKLFTSDRKTILWQENEGKPSATIIKPEPLPALGTAGPFRERQRESRNWLQSQAAYTLPELILCGEAVEIRELGAVIFNIHPIMADATDIVGKYVMLRNTRKKQYFPSSSMAFYTRDRRYITIEHNASNRYQARLLLPLINGPATDHFFLTGTNFIL